MGQNLRGKIKRFIFVLSINRINICTMKVVIYQKYPSGGVNFLYASSVASEEEATELARAESEWLEDSGFPGVCLWEYECLFEALENA